MSLRPIPGNPINKLISLACTNLRMAKTWIDVSLDTRFILLNDTRLFSLYWLIFVIGIFILILPYITFLSTWRRKRVNYLTMIRA